MKYLLQATPWLLLALSLVLPYSRAQTGTPDLSAVSGAFWKGNGTLQRHFGIITAVEHPQTGLYLVHTTEPLTRMEHIVLLDQVGANLPTYPDAEARIVLYNEYANPIPTQNGTYVTQVYVTNAGIPADLGVSMIVLK